LRQTINSSLLQKYSSSQIDFQDEIEVVKEISPTKIILENEGKMSRFFFLRLKLSNVPLFRPGAHENEE
jgi:hypothetical protein